MLFQLFIALARYTSLRYARYKPSNVLFLDHLINVSFAFSFVYLPLIFLWSRFLVIFFFSLFLFLHLVDILLDEQLIFATGIEVQVLEPNMMRERTLWTVAPVALLDRAVEKPFNIASVSSLSLDCLLRRFSPLNIIGCTLMVLNFSASRFRSSITSASLSLRVLFSLKRRSYSSLYRLTFSPTGKNSGRTRDGIFSVLSLLTNWLDTLLKGMTSSAEKPSLSCSCMPLELTYRFILLIALC